ncbi:glycerate kinase [Biomphalaria pfeifferi]|uniref:Glycerate kinase n=1 Tax=Biomphalaria pfeifferi TaxID=112525 RepID=A0AAD8F407_BIOPF|nr:glycerate kinase [Biomphalaria pfeifferi]
MSLIKHLKQLYGRSLKIQNVAGLASHPVSVQRVLFKLQTQHLQVMSSEMSIRNFHNSSFCFQEALLKKRDRMTEIDLKADAADLFKTAVKSVCPKVMIENVLQYNRATSTLKVQDKTYTVNKNIFVVGFGEAVLGMAKVVEDILSDHLVTGIISIPKGLKEEIFNIENNRDMFLSPTSKIQVFEGAATVSSVEMDQRSYNAAIDIQNLVSNLSPNDILIVVLSEGGSTLCPSPYPPITLLDLFELTRLLARNGATVREINTVRKNIEILKGGGLALLARPAKVVSLILSSVIGDAVDLIASGPTCPTQRTPHHCMEILMRLGILDKTPEGIRKFLEKEIKQLNMIQAQAGLKSTQKKVQEHQLEGVQNVIVGNNLIACEAAASRATELGYLPVILTTEMTGEARKVGSLYAKLAKFVMFCFDRKASWEPNSELSIMELELVSLGIKKKWINYIANTVDKAHNMNRDICIIAGGDTVVHVRGSGQGGKCMESVLAAAIALQEEFRVKKLNVAECRMCYLSCDSDGHDGVTKMAGAVVDLEFLDKVEASGLSMREYLENNDSFRFFEKVNQGNNFIQTNLTGTNIMNVMIMLVEKPREVKYQYKD